MTTKILSGSYPTGYYLKTPVTILSITGAGYVGGHGVYSPAAPPNAYTVINDGKIAGSASGIYLGDGGLVTNGSAADTTALITGATAIRLQQYGTVANFGSIISSAAAGFGIYFNEPGPLTNGSAQNTTALIQGFVGVLMTSEPTVAGVVNNFGTIRGVGVNAVGALMGFGGVLTNEADATIEGDGDGVKGTFSPVAVTNYGVIVGAGSQANAAGVYLSAGGVVTNGNLSNTAASIQGYETGVLIAGAAGVVKNFGTIATSAEPSNAAVELTHGGSVTNGAATDLKAQIVGSEGVQALNLIATVTNFGRIVGLAGTSPGVGLGAGGVVVNGSAQDTVALIVGGRGIDISGAVGTVTNFGTVQGAARPGYFGSTQYAGVNLLGGGVLTNGSTGDTTALIDGYDGVLLAAASTAVNFGTIQASGGYGAHLYGNATMTNGSATDTHAVVGGWIGAELYDASNLTNFGTVAGAGGVAVTMEAATSRLNAEAGSVFKGAIVANAGLVDFVSGAVTISAIQSSGTITGAGTVILNGGVSTLAAGAVLTVAEIIVAGGATTVNISAPTLGYAKLWTQTAGALSVASGDRMNFSGAGNSFAGTLAGSGTVAFTGGTDALTGTTLKAASVIIGAATVTLSGTIKNSSAVSVSSPNLIVAAAGASLTGSGSVNLSNLATNKITGASAGATLTIAGSKITGAGNLGGGLMTLVNQAGGTINGNQSTALTIDTGAAAITNAGLIENTGAGGTTIKSAVANTGTLTVTKAVLLVEGAVTGAGTVKIAGGTADFAGAFAENVAFTSTTGVLELAHSTSYTGSISGFSKAGTTSLDLLDITFGASTKASYSGTTTSGTLTVTDGTHTAHLKLTGDYTASKFSVASDGHGGTTVVDPTMATAIPRFVAAVAGFAALSGGATSTPLQMRPLDHPMLAAVRHTAIA